MHIPFNASERSSLGIEVELAIVDRDTRGLVSAASPIIDGLGRDHPDGAHPKIKHELFECTVEIITGICTTVSEARADLERTLKELSDPLDARGLDLICAGSHPFSPWQEQVVSPNPRYAALIEEIQWAGRRLQIFGVHYHVGVRSAEKVIQIANALNTYLPHFLALSASSPYWAGFDTGMASSRSKVFECLPTAGLPYQLSDWDEFESFMATFIEAEAITSIRDVWWDIRPHPDFGTVELRICDGIPTMAEVSSLAAMAQSLVDWMDGQLDAGLKLPVPRGWVVRQNKWKASRHGLDADLIVDDRGTLESLPEAIAETVATLSATARSLGCLDELEGVLSIMDRGASYTRQREVVAAGGTLVDVVGSLVGELESGRPTPPASAG